MPLSSSIVGLELPESVVTVTPRMALAYAAGIADDCHRTYDDADPAFAVSPFYCVSLEWRIVSVARGDQFGLSPAEAVRSVHAGQATTFHAPIKAGTKVRVSGRVIGIRATRAGALSQSRLSVSDADTDAALTSTITTALYRDVAVAGPDRQDGDAAQNHRVVEGAIEDHSIVLDRWFAHRYTECAAIWNPIHTERTVALSAGLPDTIVHGTALWALAGRTIVSRLAPNAPDRLRMLSGRFAAMVLSGTAIVVRLVRDPARPREVSFSVLNAEGRPAVSDGYARFA